MLQPIKTALASFGMSGRVFHGPFLKAYSEFELVTIFERTKNESANMFPNAEIVRNFQSILEDPIIELVIINTPNYLHYEMTKNALQAGKHVVVEKPFTSTVQQAEELIAIAAQNELMLTVYHNRRWDSDFLTIQKLIRDGQLGQITHFEAHFDRYRPDIGVKAWKEDTYEGAGILYDLGSHLIDQALVLFGKPISMSTDIQIQREKGKVPDYFSLTFKYKHFQAVLTAGMLVKELGPKYILKGELGEFIKYGQDPQEKALDDGASANDPIIGDEPSKIWGKLNNEVIPSQRGDYGQFYRGVYNAIRRNKKAPVDPTEALTVIEFIEKAIRAQEHLAN